ncbi:DUF1566 domain-containing protein [Hydrogenophaga sp. RWCD_12]|uniref:DUF1566 domain-containing protein n=1 Tax=Hydrogenophaga sp. RWCD_12 TaxID=3391190 RepID=UPI0039853D0C
MNKTFTAVSDASSSIRWAIAVALCTWLAACGGSGTSADPHAGASAAWQDPSQLSKGAALSTMELTAAEKRATAADASSPTALDELPAGQIAAKSAYASGAVARKALAVRIPVYRFYNGRTGAHFFTTNTTERDTVVATLSPPFSLEGAAFSVASAYSPGLSPVHRFFNTQTGVHFYTISEAERANVVATLPHFQYEGVAYYASQVAGQGLIPFYRFYVPSKGFHFYTASETEKNSIIANLAATYSFEGIGYYVLDSNWIAEKLPHTGLTSSQCYQPASSTLTACSSSLVTDFNAQQDGHRAAITPMHYSAVGGRPLTSCVRDDVTGLIWEGKEASGARYGNNIYTNLGGGAPTDVSGYVAEVNTANLCGFSDWRLPTTQELLSLVDYGRIAGLPLNPTAFPNTGGGTHWTSDLWGGASAWIVHFGASSGYSSFANRTSTAYVRLVRGSGPSGARFTYSTVPYGSDAANNLVSDAWTGLQWRRCEEGRVWSGSTCTGNPATFTHEQALAHARVQAGWRLPNIKELASLTDLAVGGAAAIHPAAFPGASGTFLWSSSPYAGDPYYAWYIYFGYGTVNYGSSRSSPYAIRLVLASQ